MAAGRESGLVRGALTPGLSPGSLRPSPGEGRKAQELLLGALPSWRLWPAGSRPLSVRGAWPVFPHGRLPFGHRERFAHRRRAENSGARGPDRDRLRGASDRPPGASHLPRGANDSPRRANDPPRRASDLSHRANGLPHGASDLPWRASGLTLRASDLPSGANDLPLGANDSPRGAIGSTRGDCDGGMRGAGRRHDEREAPERERDGGSADCSDPRSS